MIRVVHWTAYTGSGMNAVAESWAESERRLGLDAVLCNIDDQQQWEHTYDADIHVAHTHFPQYALKKKLRKPLKLVFVAHGTPEHVLTESLSNRRGGAHGMGDGLMLMQHWLRVASARVTMWPRHQQIYQTMVDRGTPVHLVPLGVDREWWRVPSSKGKWGGDPSLFSAENFHTIKWPLDLVLMWPWIYPELENASLHLGYVPLDVHRWMAPLINGTGAGYAMHWSPTRWPARELRGILQSIDYFVGLVKYGDHNQLSMQAAAAGATTISYPGNPYADYWIAEGDQRMQAAMLLEILKGDAKPRTKTPVPDIMETAQAMKTIYEDLLDAPRHVAAKASRVPKRKP